MIGAVRVLWDPDVIPEETRPVNGKPSLQNAGSSEAVAAAEYGWEQVVGRFIGIIFP
jgi:hypothetical protein